MTWPACLAHQKAQTHTRYTRVHTHPHAHTHARKQASKQKQKTPRPFDLVLMEEAQSLCPRWHQNPGKKLYKKTAWLGNCLLYNPDGVRNALGMNLCESSTDQAASHLRVEKPVSRGLLVHIHTKMSGAHLRMRLSALALPVPPPGIPNAGFKIRRSDPGLQQTCSRSDTGKTRREPRPFKPDRALNQAIRPAFVSPGLMRSFRV